MLKCDAFNIPPKIFLKQSVLSNDYVSASNLILPQFDHHEAKDDIGKWSLDSIYIVKSVYVYIPMYMSRPCKLRKLLKSKLFHKYHVTPAKILMATTVLNHVCHSFLRKLRIHHSAISIGLCYVSLSSWLIYGSAPKKKNAVTLTVNYSEIS